VGGPVVGIGGMVQRWAAGGLGRGVQRWAAPRRL
jgi:hypothetical protein